MYELSLLPTGEMVLAASHASATLGAICSFFENANIEYLKMKCTF